MNPITGGPSILNVTASVVSSLYPVPYPSRFGGDLDVIICITDTTGAPVTDLQESEVSIAIAGQGMDVVSKIVFSSFQPAHDENGDPLTDSDGNPIMVAVPGPARQAGLSGCYRMTVAWTSGVPVGRVTAEVAIARESSRGQTLAPFDVASLA